MSGQMTIKGVIFDLDGSLVDSMWMWKQIDVEFLQNSGCEVPDGLQDAIEGMSFTETAEYFQKTFALPLMIEEIKDCWNRMAFEKYRSEVGFKPGAGLFLDYLREHGIRTGIATSNSRELVRTVLASLGANDKFDAIVTSCDVAKGKPAPDVYLKAAEMMGVAPSDCLVFEDVTAGIMAGKNAGMHVIAVDDEFSRYQEERKRRLADGFIRCYDEVTAWMESEQKADFPAGSCG